MTNYTQAEEEKEDLISIPRVELEQMLEGLGELVSFCHGIDLWLTKLSYHPNTPGRMTSIATQLFSRVSTYLGKFHDR